jgi:hypothetical protein
MTDKDPPSPWTAVPPTPTPAQSPRRPIRDEAARHDLLVSVGLGMLLGGGVVLLLCALYVILS